MIHAARRYNVSPVLLLAIAGQEQALGNPVVAAGAWIDPWNVGTSWQLWTGSYQQAANLAARALRVKLDAPGRQSGMTLIRWMETPSNPAGMWAITQTSTNQAIPTPGWVNGVRWWIQQIGNVREQE